MKPILIAHGKLKGTFVARNDKNLPHAVEQYRASPANGQVLFDLAAQVVVKIAVDVSGETLG